MLKIKQINKYSGGGGFNYTPSDIFKTSAPIGEQISNELQKNQRSQLLPQAKSAGVNITKNVGSLLGSPKNQTLSALSGGSKGLGFLSGSGLSGLAGGIAQGVSAISNTQGLTGAAKQAALGDGILGAVSTGLSAFGPVGSLVGAGLNLVNGIGGSLLNGNKTATMAKDFKINSAVQQSGSYGGVAAGAQEAQMQGGSYRKAGLVGKLFTKTGNLQNQMIESQSMQKLGAGILDSAKQNFAQQAGSTDLVSTRNTQKNYNGGIWTSGQMTFGKKGMKINQLGGTMEQAGSSATKTVQDFQKLGKAVKVLNLKKIKHQFGGTLKKSLKPKADKIETVSLEDENHGYNKWLQSLPDRLKDTADYDLKGYFDKHGPIHVKGEMHLSDEYKKPNHATFSKESIYNSPEHEGGEWRKADDGTWEFVASAWNIKNVGVDSLQSYFKQNEPSARLVLPVTSHKEGGAINVIADGAFHSRKHTLKELDELAEAPITLKGIPVVSEAEGGQIVQHAEVEHNELILHYELTKELEKLLEEGTDEAAIKAGKLLSKEIVKNTKDSSSKLIKNG